MLPDQRTFLIIAALLAAEFLGSSAGLAEAQSTAIDWQRPEDYPVQVGPWLKYSRDPEAQADWREYTSSQAGENSALWHLPIFRFRGPDGARYFVQAEDASKAWALYVAIRKADDEFLGRMRGRIIQGLFDDIPRWPGVNRTEPRRQ